MKKTNVKQDNTKAERLNNSDWYLEKIGAYWHLEFKGGEISVRLGGMHDDAALIFRAAMNTPASGDSALREALGIGTKAINQHLIDLEKEGRACIELRMARTEMMKALAQDPVQERRSELRGDVGRLVHAANYLLDDMRLRGLPTKAVQQLEQALAATEPLPSAEGGLYAGLPDGADNVQLSIARGELAEELRQAVPGEPPAPVTDAALHMEGESDLESLLTFIDQKIEAECFDGSDYDKQWQRIKAYISEPTTPPGDVAMQAAREICEKACLADSRYERGKCVGFEFNNTEAAAIIQRALGSEFQRGVHRGLQSPMESANTQPALSENHVSADPDALNIAYQHVLGTKSKVERNAKVGALAEDIDRHRQAHEAKAFEEGYRAGLEAAAVVADKREQLYGLRDNGQSAAVASLIAEDVRDLPVPPAPQGRVG